MNSLYRKAIAPTRVSYNMYRRYNEEKDEEQDLQIENKRHALDRLFDVLNVGQYVSAGAVRGAVRDDMSIVGGIIDGLRAGNPLGKGYEKGEHSYSQVLTDIGWDKEDNPDGKWYNPFSWSLNNSLHNVAGFVGDIMLDPMTYVSGGTSALVKGTGKPGAKATHKVVNEMTQEVAEGIIIKQAAKRNLTKSMDDIAKEASKFVKQYNKLAGVREGAKDVTLSLANAPLGEKIFGEAAEKSKTLIKGEDLQKLSDEIGIGKAYSAIRDKVYGGKLGKMFSSSHTLYQLSKTDPGAVYDFMKQVETARGTAGDMQSAIKIIRENAKQFNLDADETRQLIEVMEDSSRWSTVRKYMKFSDTETGKVLKKELEEVKLRTQKELDDLLETKSIVESMKGASEKQLSEATSALDGLRDEYRDRLTKLDLSKIEDKKQWSDAMKALEDEINQIKIDEENFIKAGRQEYPAEDVIKHFDAYKQTDEIWKMNKKKPYEEVVTRTPRTGVQHDRLKTFINKPDGVDDIEFNKILAELEKRDYVSIPLDKAQPTTAPSKLVFTKPDNLSNKNYKKLIQELHENNMLNTSISAEDIVKGNFDSTVEFTVSQPHGMKNKDYYDKLKKYKNQNIINLNKGTYTKSIKQSKSIDDFLSKFKGWTSELDIEEGIYKLTPPANQKNFVETIIRSPIEKPNKTALIEDVSRYLYGRPDIISSATWDKNIEKVVDMIRRGNPDEDILAYIEKHADYFNGRSGMIYPHIAREVGYDNWTEHYKKPMKELRDKLSKNTITQAELNKMARLEQDFIERSKWLDKFRYMETEDIRKLVSEQYRGVDGFTVDNIRDIEKATSVEDIQDKLKPGEINNPDVDARRNKFYAEDKAINEMEDLNTPSVKNYKTGEFDDPNSIGKKQFSYSKELGYWEKHEARSYAMEQLFSDKKGSMLVSDDVSKLNNAQRKLVEQVMNEAEVILNNNPIFAGKEFIDLKPKQKELLFKMANDSHNKKFNNFGKEAIKTKSEQEKILAQNALKRRHDKQRLKYLADNAKEGATVTISTGKNSSTDAVISSMFLKGGKPYTDLIKADGTILKDVALEDILRFRNDVSSLTSDEILSLSKTSQEFVERQNILTKDLEFAKSKLTNVDANYINKYDDLINDYTYRAELVKENISTLEKEVQTFQTALEKGDLTNIEDLTNKVKKFEDILASDDAYETYIKAQIGTKEFNKIIDDASPIEKVVEIVSNPNKPISEKVENLAKKLRQDLIDIGMSEVEIGKLGEGQFDAMMYKYLPHILTEDGAKLFANQEAIKKRFPQFGDDLGYGRKFNPHAKARTLKIIPDGAGGWIENPNILEANKFFKDNFNDILKGKNVFSEDIAEIYTMRALKNTELIYDSKYMDEMLEMVGDSYNFTKAGKEGYSSVMNFGKTREKVAQISKINTSLDISDAVTQHLSNKDIMDSINETTTLRMSAMTLSDDVDMGKLRKSIFNEELSNTIQNFIDENFTDEIRKGLREKHGQGFLKNSQMEKYLDDLSMPLLEINKEQFDGMRNGITSVQARLENNVKRSLTSYHRNVIQKSHHRHLLDSLTNIDSMGIDELKDVINKYKNYADEFDIERLNRMEKKLLQHAELGELQIKEVNNAIVEKSNQARKLQIQKDNNNFLNLYDKFTHLIKLNQTTILPSFHARNQYSNIFQNWLEIGGDAVSIDFQTQAAKVLKHDGATDGILKIVNSDGTLSAMGWDEIYNTAKQYGVIDEGFFAQEIGATAGSSGMLNKIPGKFDPTDTNNFIPYKKGEKIGSFVENKDRLVHFASQLSRGMSIEDAAESVNKFLFDYGDLSAFEMSTMKRIIPYYTWLRKNAGLQLEMILERPEKYRMIAKISSGIENMNDEDDKIDKAFVNDFAKDWIQTPFNVTNPEGREEPVLWNPNLPYMDINRIPDITQPIESLKELFTQTNPLIKTPIEQIINRNVFFDSPIVKDGDSQILSRIDHILSQHGQYPVMRGSLRKEGADKALHTLNSLSGVKLLSYDYDKYKEMKIRELLAKKKGR